MKQKIAKWYRQGLWTTEMVANAFSKGILTAQDYILITGKDMAEA